MSVPEPAIKGAEAAKDAARAWQEVRADPSIQFEPSPYNQPPIQHGGSPVELQPGSVPVEINPSGVPVPSSGPVQIQELPKPPHEPSHLGEILRQIFEPIGKALGIAWPVMQWILIGLGVLLALYLVWRLIAPWIERRRIASAVEGEGDPGWAPERSQAEALLDDADALAAQGKFAEATHLLLIRSVEHIASARPDWVQPASTTREISAFVGLPDRARGAFNLIAERVERSLFALRALGRDDWLAARAAYADFALERFDQEPAR